MSVPALLADLRRRDIQVWADGDRLRCNAPAGVLTPELRHQLQQRKNDILEFLRSATTLTEQQRAIVPLQPRGELTPIFGVGGHNGDVFCYRALAQHLGEDQPLFGLQPPGLDGHSEPLARVADLAAYFAAQIRAFRPAGPCIIAGFCAGGMIAFELARQLLQERTEISFLALFGAPYPMRYRRLPRLRERLAQQVERVVKHTRALASLSFGEGAVYAAERLHNLKVKRAAERSSAPDPVLALREKVERATLAAARRYTPGHFEGRVGLFLPCKDWVRSRNEPLRWRSVTQDPEEYFGPDGCNSDNMLREPYARTFAELFRQCTSGALQMGRRSVSLSIIALALACSDVPLSTSLEENATDPAVNAVVRRIDLGTLGGRSSYATDVNNDGTVVGWSYDASAVSRAFRWTEADGMVDLGSLPGDEWSRAISITGGGRILGVSGTGSGFAGTPVTWSPSGEIAALPIPLLPGADWGEPADFNPQGEVVGWDVVVLQHAWSWSESRKKYDITANAPEGSYEGAASAINASGLVVGANHASVCVGDAACWHAFLWSYETGYRDLGTPVDDADVTLVGLGLNDSGTVVGWTRIPSGPLVGTHPYRWSHSEGFTLLPSFSYGYALSINERGTAVGAGWDPVYEVIQAIVWPASGGAVKLSPGDPYPQVAAAINDAGAVAGWSSLSGGETHATLWILGRVVGVLHAEVQRESAPSLSSAAAPGGDPCLADVDALVSRAALFACVMKSDGNP